MRERAGSAAQPATRCRNLRRGSFILDLPLTSHHSITSSAHEQRRRNLDAERLCGLEIDCQLEFGRLLDRQITRIGSLEKTVDEIGRTTEDSGQARTI